MPTNASSVGPLDIPIPQVGGYSAFTDPVTVGFADYFAFWIRYGLADKLRDPNDNIPDPLPAANVHTYDPQENWVRNDLPALYVWWAGESRRQDRTIVNATRIRTLRIFYAAAEVKRPKSGRIYSGLPSAIDAILFESCEQGFHYQYGYNNDPPGTPIHISLRLRGWTYDRGKEDFAQRVPNVSSAPGGQAGGTVVTGWPVLMGTMTVYEDIRLPAGGDGTGDTMDLLTHLNVNDPSDTRGPITIMDRYLISASEADDSGQ